MFGKVADVIAHDRISCDIGHPFVMAGYNGDLPPGSREIFAGNKGLQSLSFAVCRGTSRHQFIK